MHYVNNIPNLSATSPSNKTDITLLHCRICFGRIDWIQINTRYPA